MWYPHIDYFLNWITPTTLKYTKINENKNFPSQKKGEKGQV